MQVARVLTCFKDRGQGDHSVVTVTEAGRARPVQAKRRTVAVGHATVSGFQL